LQSGKIAHVRSLLSPQVIHYKTAGLSIDEYFDAGYLSRHGGLLIQMTNYMLLGGVVGSMLGGDK
jgi:hypothetical protein